MHQRHLVDGILFCLMWHTAANTAGSTFCVQASEFGVAAMAELVVERPATVLVGTASRFARGAAHVWRYVLTTVGPQRIYVCMEPPSTTHAGDWMFIVPEVVDGRLRHVAYEGRAATNSQGEQELEQRAQVFRTSASFWEVGTHEWQTKAGPVRLKSGKRHSGKHLASWLTHAMRCSRSCMRCTCMASWDSTACGWRGCLMHVMFMCIHRCFCIFGLNCFCWRGGLMHGGR